MITMLRRRWPPRRDRADRWADGEPDFTIRPPGRRPVCYVTLYSYPRLPSSTLLGADARATPGLLATLEEARDSGKTTVSNQTTVPGDQDLPVGQRPVAFELFVPVYRVELRPDASVAERRRQFLGWAYGQFRAGDFLDGAMQAVAPTTGVELHDLEAGSDSRVASHPRNFRAGGRYVRENTFTFGERTFELRYAPLAGNAILTERTIGAPVGGRGQHPPRRPAVAARPGRRPLPGGRPPGPHRQPHRGGQPAGLGRGAAA